MRPIWTFNSSTIDPKLQQSKKNKQYSVNHVLWSVVFLLGCGVRILMIFCYFWRPGLSEHPQGLLLDDISCFMMILAGFGASFGELFWLLLKLDASFVRLFLDVCVCVCVCVLCVFYSMWCSLECFLRVCVWEALGALNPWKIILKCTTVCIFMV